MAIERPDPIEHVIVLMLENRSFDQMLGACQSLYPELCGIDSTVSPRVNCDSDGNVYEQQAGAPYVINSDPHHDLVSVLKQIGAPPTLGPAGWGTPWTRLLAALWRLLLVFWNSDLFGWIHVYLERRRDKARLMRAPQYEGHFVQAFIDGYRGSTRDDRLNVMRYFALDRLPTLHLLAKHFTICDQWFSSVPGPTWANRFFHHSGTSLGTTIMPESKEDWENIDLFDQRTIYDELLDKDLEWRIYYHDFPQALALSRLWTYEARVRIKQMEELEQDFSQPSSIVPNFVFIEPQYFDDGNDDHPPNHSMRAQQLIARVYNALRANDDLWNSSLFIVMYDEHGGFYDHVEPPPAVPPGKPYKDYSYDQYGVRVPALLISPWVGRGVFSKRLDHTSVGKYLCEKKWTRALGKRMKTANTFADAIIKSDQARTDTPLRIDVKSPETRTTVAVVSVEMNPNQKAIDTLSDICDPQPQFKGAVTGAPAKPRADEIRERAQRILQLGPATTRFKNGG